MLDYDATRDALYKPYLRPTVFAAVPLADPLANPLADHRQLGVEAARLAYWPAERDAGLKAALIESLAKAGFAAPSLFNDPQTGTQGFAAFRAHDQLALVAFRGTEPEALCDLASDLAFSLTPWPEAGGRVHHGFAQAARSTHSWLDAWLGEHPRQSLLVSGHSLGAAIATLVASYTKPTSLVTIGSPRVGDQAFADTLRGIAIHRLVNCCDAVTRVPPTLLGYVDVGLATHILADGSIAEETHATPGAGPALEAHLEHDRSLGRQQYMADHAWRPGCVLIRDLADHAPINYVRAVFPQL